MSNIVYSYMTLIIMWYQRACNCRQYCSAWLGLISAVCWSCDSHVMSEYATADSTVSAWLGIHQCSTAYITFVPWVYILEITPESSCGFLRFISHYYIHVHIINK